VTNERPRIVIVEDERAMREMLVLALEREGYDIRALSNGAGLAALVGAWNADLVMLDIGLPGADGSCSNRWCVRRAMRRSSC
jgi:DNA-binding response OmpR family regulator